MNTAHPTITVTIDRLEPITESIEHRAPDLEVPEQEIRTSNITATATTSTTTLTVRRRTEVALTSMRDYVVAKKPLPLNRLQQLDEQLVKMIVKGYHALRMVEEKEFRKLVEMLNPGYTLPTRKTLSESLLPKVYCKVMEAVKNELNKATALCITTDGWKYITNDDYIAITAHFVNPDTHKLSSVMIGCINFDESHTSVNISDFLRQKFREWNIENKIGVIVTDNAANILTAVRLGGWRSISCFAHTINLVVQDSIIQISETVTKVKLVVEYFRRSQPGAKKLKEIQEQMNISQLKLKQDISTRWNSTYDMLNRLLRMKDAIIATIAIMRPDLALSQDDWTTVQKAIPILSVFYEVTNEISGEEYVSASKYIVFCKLMCKHVDFIYTQNLATTGPIKGLITTLKAELKCRFGDIEKHVLLREATILDPRFKKSVFRDAKNFDTAAAELKLKIGSIVLPNERHTHHSVVEPPAPDPLKTASIWDMYDEVISHLIPENPTAAGIVEFDKYIQEPLLNRHQEPLPWWEERKAVYPRLYSSVPCERVFSKAGLTLNDRRTRLTSKKLSQLMFISCN